MSCNFVVKRCGTDDDKVLLKIWLSAIMTLVIFKSTNVSIQCTPNYYNLVEQKIQ